MLVASQTIMLRCSWQCFGGKLSQNWAFYAVCAFVALFQIALMWWNILTSWHNHVCRENVFLECTVRFSLRSVPKQLWLHGAREEQWWKRYERLILLRTWAPAPLICSLSCKGSLVDTLITSQTLVQHISTRPTHTRTTPCCKSRTPQASKLTSCYIAS